MLITISTQYSYNFFFNDTASTKIYTLSLHDALPISKTKTGDLFDSAPASRKSARTASARSAGRGGDASYTARDIEVLEGDRKSTRLNSSHVEISYAVFCLKKKKQYTSMQKSKHNFNL